VYKRAGKRVREWRRAHNEMSQVDLAQKAGVSVGCLQAFELGIRATRAANLAKIAKAVKMSVAELMADEESSPPKDERAKGLTEEDLHVARLFHDAITDVRTSVKKQLRAAAERSRDAAPFDSADEGRSHQFEVLLADVEARLPAQSSETLGQLRTLLVSDIHFREQVLELAERLLRQPAVLPILNELFEDDADVGAACETLRHLISEKRRH
jgi:transcriptional regulator with XRE-family HTH domain